MPSFSDGLICDFFLNDFTDFSQFKISFRGGGGRREEVGGGERALPTMGYSWQNEQNFRHTLEGLASHYVCRDY